MKIFFKIFLFQFFILNSLSAKPFLISGTVSGKEALKFVYAFESDYGKLTQVASIVDNEFKLKGEFSDHPRFGALPMISLLFLKDSLNESEIERRRLISQRKHDVCRIIAGPSVTVNYNTDQKIFIIKGSEQNKIQNLYLNRLAQFRKTRDSLFILVRKTDLSDTEKNEKIDQIGANLFTATMRDFIKLVKAHPSEVSLQNFSTIVYDQGISGQEVLQAFNLFPAEIRDSEYGKNVYRDIEDKLKTEALLAKPAYSVGQKFPDFSLADSGGEKRTGNTLYGKYTLVDFWATWCVPCRKETPNVIQAYQKFSAKGFKVVTISIDSEADREKWQKAIIDDKMQGFHNLFNGGDSSGLARELKVVAIPTNYLLDPQGKIVATNLRGDALIDTLNTLL
jgi:thiol-disulfide isomerase/thioredoxin